MKAPAELKITRVLAVVIASMIAAFSVAAQTAEKKPTPTPDRNRDIVALLNDARLAAPELAVDTFLKVVESKKVTDPVWRKEIIDEALRMIDDVKHPIAMRIVPVKGIVINNTDAYLWGMAFNEKLDGLSLKSRVIMQMADIDIVRAKRIVFEMGGQFRLKPRSCEDLLTYETGEIYPAVATVAKSAFNEKEIADGRRALFVAPWIENIESPTQISSAIDLVQEMQGSPIEKQMLFAALSQAMSRNFNDDRTFTSAVGWAGGPAKKIEKLIAAESDFVKADIVSAYRESLLKNLRGARCEENEIKREDPLPSYIEAANRLFPGKPISVEDIISSEVKDGAKSVDLLATSNDTQRIRSELISLTGAGPPDNPYLFDKGNIEWQSKVTEFVDRIPSWKPREEISDLRLFSLRAALYGAILQIAPEGELMKTVLRRYLRYMAGTPIQKENYIQWSSQVRMVKGFLGKNAEVFYEVAAEFPNPNLKLLVAANKLLAQPKKGEPTPPTPKQ